MRRALVTALVRACDLHDRLRLDYLTHHHRLADWSNTLDERWHTGVWHTPKDTPTDAR